MFTDRHDAGHRLSDALRDRQPVSELVLGIPRGGVIVAAEVARSLGHELDIEVVRKIGAPGDPEYAIAAVDADGEIIGGEGLSADAAYLRRAAAEAGEEIRRRLVAYRGDHPAPRVAGRSVLLVDDGVATGFTLLAAVRSLRRRGAAHITAATPVASTAAERELSRVADDVVALWVDPHLRAISQYYTRFAQVSDEEVVDALRSVWQA
ncbi:MAG: phosphoribosyltransferase [Coriobacteriia bacterium]|nr:phosphoribosyltransferase [Coriobacteriia bacterium]MBN2847337.1 phosphoribosyltransferase [Coriobacteriia bacterium]